ncbi:septum formation initiator family protein [Streptomyces sp. NBC_00234]|uniref:FtsB family cell division protein n=1 Tax=Streptomyces sp. NBC_00234 TaxID=2903638 RepID=UPI002E2E5DDD|nr:septum formation initiator family protein [Streptomyces sp. NBC_00234]
MTKPAEQLKGRAARLARLMPSGPSNAARTPFVLLVVLLLGGGLITLLLLNSSLNEGSIRLTDLKRETTELTDEQQALQRDVDSYSEPDALERRARELGMVPGGSPAFLDPDGTVRGNPVEATAEPTPTVAPKPVEPAPDSSPSSSASSADASPDPSASQSASAQPSPGASGTPTARTSGTPGAQRQAPAEPESESAAETPPTTSPGR